MSLLVVDKYFFKEMERQLICFYNKKYKNKQINLFHWVYTMGKTNRNVNAGSCSTDYHSKHNRGFAKQEKARSHRSIRAQNKGCDEETIQLFNCKQKHMNTHWAASYYGPACNVSNQRGHYSTDGDLFSSCKHVWSPKERTQIDTLNAAMTSHSQLPEVDQVRNETYVQYLKATKKQIERRGEAKAFGGHHR
jgi:carboxypeptidase C (cathepsin A)